MNDFRMKFMFSAIFKTIFVFSIVCFSAFAIAAQSNKTVFNSVQGKDAAEDDDFPKNIKETLAKTRIDKEKKDYEELLARSEEALALSKELEQSFAQRNNFSPEDQKKLNRLEKIINKIRKELGSDDEDSERSENSFNLSNAVKSLTNKSSILHDELKKSTRYSVSVTTFETSNSLLKTIRYLRFNKD